MSRVGTLFGSELGSLYNTSLLAGTEAQLFPLPISEQTFSLTDPLTPWDAAADFDSSVAGRPIPPASPTLQLLADDGFVLTVNGTPIQPSPPTPLDDDLILTFYGNGTQIPPSPPTTLDDDFVLTFYGNGTQIPPSPPTPLDDDLVPTVIGTPIQPSPPTPLDDDLVPTVVGTPIQPSPPTPLDDDLVQTNTQGATFILIEATHWHINSADGFIHDNITIQNSAHPSDYMFV